MRTRHLMALFTGVLILAIILPISLSIWQAARQAKMQFYRELDDYSNRIVVRTLQVADQAREALREADAHTAASCSPEHLLTLRRIAYTHRYIQEVLWLRDSVPQCSSLEDHSVAVTFPPPDHIAPDGYRTWLTSINDLGLDHQMTAMGSRQHMVMIDPVSFIDVVPASEEKIHTMLFGLDHQKMVISSQPLPAKVWQRIKDPHVDMLTLDNTVYRIQRIPELGSGIVTWSSTLPLQQRIRQQLFFWLPAGIFTSLLATWLLLRLLSTCAHRATACWTPSIPKRFRFTISRLFRCRTGKLPGLRPWPAGSSPMALFYRRISLFPWPSRPGSSRS